ncbi:hypothetical protein RRF57_006053 [Xylaria bambusicola]|uniref:Uncharacterized protein n=1 Tax=Xylaria bambusicola TaxID=326684 RepID=A0AAN7Z8J2_9PEZI
MPMSVNAIPQDIIERCWGFIGIPAKVYKTFARLQRTIFPRDDVDNDMVLVHCVASGRVCDRLQCCVRKVLLRNSSPPYYISCIPTLHRRLAFGSDYGVSTVGTNHKISVSFGDRIRMEIERRHG